MNLIECLYTRNMDETKKNLETSQVTTKEINEVFQEACKLGYSDFVALFLKDSRVEPRLPSIQAIEYSVSSAITGSFGLQQAAYYGNLNSVEILLHDKRSDPSAGDYRCIKLIVNRAESSDKHKQILQKLTDYCWDNYLDYKKALGEMLSNRIEKILSFNDDCNKSTHWKHHLRFNQDSP